MTEQDPGRCPLCQQPNQCAMAAGGEATGCWCMHASIADSALLQLAPDQRGGSCICPHCAPEPAASAAEQPI